MRVIKVLNNSLVLALNDEGQEIILMGKGIGFQKTIGYKLSPKEIDKVFVLKDREPDHPAGRRDRQHLF